MTRFAVILIALVTLAACTAPTETVTGPPADLGDFRLGHNIVVAPDFQKGPVSREANKEEFIASMKKAIDTRFGRYDGTRLVHFGVNLSGYALAPPGLPLLFSPKSALIITVTAWDDRAGGKFNEEPREIIVLESFTGGSLVGSGYTLSPEEQMENLTYNATREIEEWMHQNRDCLVDDVPAETLANCWKTSKAERQERQRQLDELR
ncbi:hypothetical protein [Shimia sp.]|uniref:hypothetical protein n=1 Tax=Shimia sp. TaxID=1954381 RepID=UPI003297C093